MQCGPRHPNQPAGEAVVLSPSVLFQDYEDGRLYQVSSPRGRSFQAVQRAMDAIPAIHLRQAEMYSVLNPYDTGDNDDDLLYISLWVSSN